MRKFTRITAFALALCISGAAFTACGEKKTEEKEIESAIDSMDEKELESKIEEAAEKLDKDEKEEATTEFAGYAPTDEIKKASFESGLIQIGNDIFHQGGYYTVSQFVEEYGDRYDFYYDLDNKEFNIDGIYDKSKNFSFVIVAKNDSKNKISVHFKPLNEDELSPVSDCIVKYVTSIGNTTPVFYPQYQEKLKITDTDAFLASYGYKKKDNVGDDINEIGPDCVSFSDYIDEHQYDWYCYCGKYAYYADTYRFLVKSDEKNLFGAYPIYEYSFLPDYETGTVELCCGGSTPLIWVKGTDDWKSAKESE